MKPILASRREARRLTVLFDADCGMCNRARDWLGRQPKYVELRFAAAGSAVARALYPGLSAEETLEELHVVADDGRVWRGAGAWVMCLWALKSTRSYSLSLSGPASMAVAKRVVALLSEGRYTLSQVLRWQAPNP